MTATDPSGAMPVHFPLVVIYPNNQKWVMDKEALWLADARVTLLAPLAAHFTTDGIWGPSSRLQYKGRQPFRKVADLPGSTPGDAQTIYDTAVHRHTNGTPCSVLGNRGAITIEDTPETVRPRIGGIDIIPWEVAQTDTGESLGAIEGRFFMGLASKEQAHYRWGLVARNVEALFVYWDTTNEPCVIIPELVKTQPAE